jgi:hypothetical protein
MFLLAATEFIDWQQHRASGAQPHQELTFSCK